MLKLGVSKTDIKQLPVLFRTMLTSRVRVTVLFTRGVKLITREPAVIPVIQTLVLPGKSLKRIPDVVLMILLTVHVVSRQDVRRIPQRIHLLTVLTVRTDVSMLVITPAI